MVAMNVRDMLARAAADVELKSRVGHLWSNESWEKGVEIWRAAPADEKSWMSDIHLPYEIADAQLADLAAAGYAVVPVEPTEEMLGACRMYNPCQSADGQCYDEGEIYRAMLAALRAPKP